MDPELVDQIETANDQQHDRMKAQQHQRNGKGKAQSEGAGPALPQGGAEIVMLAGMMVHMARPEPANPVTRPVHPVIFEIVEHKGERPGPPDHPPLFAEIEQAVLVRFKKHPQGKATKQCTCHGAAKAKGEADQRIARFVSIGAFLPRPQHFQQHQQDKAWNRILDGREIGHVRRPPAGAGLPPTLALPCQGRG